MNFCKYIAVAVVASVCLMSSQQARAQNHRSAWMWYDSGHPYGSANVIGNTAAEQNLINDFQFWGFDRIYASMSSWAVTDPDRIAHWNKALDQAGIQSQMLLGEPTWVYPTVRPGLLNIIQTRLIDYNASRTDPAEWIDAVHLDIEPHGLSDWTSGTSTDRRDLLLMLRDTYADVRDLLDANGQSQVKIYADLPVWYDSSSQIAWATGERDQWFDDIAGDLDGISMMAYERSTLSHINSGVQWEINNFNGEVRIGLESNAVGSGKTWATFDDLLNMADALEAYHGGAIGGIDFHPLTAWADQAEHAPILPGDFNGDGYVGLDDLQIILEHWNQNVTVGDLSMGDATNASGTGPDGYVGLDDLQLILDHWNEGTLPTPSAVPEPAGLTLLGLAGLTLLPRRSNQPR